MTTILSEKMPLKDSRALIDARPRPDSQRLRMEGLPPPSGQRPKCTFSDEASKGRTKRSWRSLGESARFRLSQSGAGFGQNPPRERIVQTSTQSGQREDQLSSGWASTFPRHVWWPRVLLGHLFGPRSREERRAMLPFVAG